MWRFDPAVIALWDPGMSTFPSPWVRTVALGSSLYNAGARAQESSDKHYFRFLQQDTALQFLYESQYEIVWSHELPSAGPSHEPRSETRSWEAYWLV